MGLSGLERVVVTIVPLQVRQNGGAVNRNMLTGEDLRRAREERASSQG
jgi:hypothetical protein